MQIQILNRYSALFSALFSTLFLLVNPGQALADRYPSRGDGQEQESVNRPRAERPRAERPRAERPRAERPRSERRPRTDYNRYGDHRNRDYRRSPYPPRYIPRSRYYGRHWYKYPRRHYYPGSHYHYRGDDFLGWLAFTAITLVIIDNLNEQQQREHELAMRGALEAPVGETIRWEDEAASGSVTTIREGTSSEGRYCREYTQGVEIGGEAQQAYGTACRNSDGSWEIMP